MASVSGKSLERSAFSLTASFPFLRFRFSLAVMSSKELLFQFPNEFLFHLLESRRAAFEPILSTCSKLSVYFLGEGRVT